jgi:small conductance mechanosensitive channel
MDIGVAYREDVDEVIEILKELGATLQKDPDHGPNILEPLEVFGLDRFEDSAVVIRARFKTKPLKQWGVKRAFYRLMKRAFDERGIEIPFPHRTIYMGEPKEGNAPPLHVDVQSKPAEPNTG